MEEVLDVSPSAQLDELEPLASPEDLLVEGEVESEGEPRADTPPPKLNEVRQYLTEIGAYSLLTPEEEITLATQIQEGKRATQKLSAITNIPEEDIRRAARAKVLEERPKGQHNISPSDGVPPGEVEKACKATPERRRLYEKVLAGEKARETFIAANLRLVVNAVKPYARKWGELDILDLIAEGNQGLMRAVETFDPQKGYRFSTYAMWWIRQSIVRYAYNARRLIRLPAHLEEALAKIWAIQGKLRREMGREPTQKEVAKELGEGWTPEKIQGILSSVRDVWSLDEPVYQDEGEEGESYLNLIESDRPTPEEAAENQALRKDLEKALKELSPNQEKAIRLRFGLDGAPPMSLAEAAEVMGLSRERIRQLEKKAMRHLFRNEKLRKWLKGT
jgi:RNA polymerase sigma factor (sigma-70 family)